MGSIFSKKKNKGDVEITEVDRAVLGLKSTRRKLENYQARLEETNINLLEEARRLKKEDKTQRAIGIMRRRKMQEKIVQKMDGMILNLQSQLNDIDMAKQQSRFIDALDIGNQALKSITQEMSLPRVEKVIEEANELHGELDTISSLLGESINPELEALAMEEVENIEVEMTKNSLPDAPKNPIVQPEPDKVQPESEQVQEEEEEEEPESEHVQEEPDRSDTPREEIAMLAS